jgi:hypothetical protein
MALASAALVAACGVPTGGPPTTIAASDVPYGLASTGAPATAPSSEPRQERAWIYLIGPDDALVPRGRDVGTGPLDARLTELLVELATGPTADERDSRLSTALPPDVQLVLAGIEDGTATIDFSGDVEAPSGRQGRQAVAQVVLSATTLPGVDSVLLTRDGDPVEAPLPSGELTDEPLMPADYAVFLTPPPPPTAAPSPSAPAQPFPADTRPDTAEPSPDAAVTVTGIRLGGHAGFDRVVLEVGGAGIPGWDVRYVTDPRSQGSGDPVAVDGAAVLQVNLSGAGLPPDTGVPEYAGPVPLRVAGTSVITEVVFDATFEGRTAVFVGTTARAPFRVYLLQAPTRVVLEVVG